MAIVSIVDHERYPQYIAANAVAFQKYGATFLARGGRSTSPEGFAADRHVIIEFESYELALACYQSPEYQEAVKLRRAYSTAHFAIVEGA